MKSYYFAVDLGATSGRTIIGTLANGELELEEISRFPNRMIEVQGHYYWDIYELYRNIVEGLKLVASRDIAITSIGIDTWGVDFVLVGKDGLFLRQPYAYRDPHTTGAPQKFFRRMPADRVYELTGLQVMQFNTLFQLDTLRRNHDSAFVTAHKILFMPDALSYLLTGEMVAEYTIASTSQLVNARTRKFEPEVLSAIAMTEKEFGNFVYPGERVGVLTKDLQRLTGLGEIPVIAVAGHDTASAVAAVPALDENFAYLSSGTWSLMGIESTKPQTGWDAQTFDFTNEGGVGGTIRILKNICGLWLLERCRAEWGETPYAGLIDKAQAEKPFRSIINPDAEVFVNPANMEEAIRRYCKDSLQPVPDTRAQIVRCIFESLAMRYREVIDNLCKLSPHPITALHVIGGGSRNDMLNQLTADATGVTVYAGPSEATAIGNIMVQAMAAGEATDIGEMRKLINHSTSPAVFKPKDKKPWDEAYERYLWAKKLEKERTRINH
jgi:rhamnulokinase